MARRRRSSMGAVGLAEDSELSKTFQAVAKEYGSATIRTGRDRHAPQRISTGSFVLDFALLGGMPTSRVSMVLGRRHSGKSMLAYKLMANAQRQFPDQVPVLIDVEGTHDSAWAETLGVDLDQLHVAEVETGEMAVDIAEAVVNSMETSILVVDSLAALTPMKEIEDSAEDAHVGLQARLISRMVRKVTSALIHERKRGHTPAVFFVNQYRSLIGGFQKFGEPLSIPGGKALEYCTSVQMDIKSKENAGKDAYGVEAMTQNEHSFKITKNKLNQGPRTGEFILQRVDDADNFLNAGDIDDAATVLTFAKKMGFYTGGGKRWVLEVQDQSFEFGKAQEAILVLREDRDFYNALRDFLLQQQAAHLGMPEDFVRSIRSY